MSDFYFLFIFHIFYKGLFYLHVSLLTFVTLTFLKSNFIYLCIHLWLIFNMLIDSGNLKFKRYKKDGEKSCCYQCTQPPATTTSMESTNISSYFLGIFVDIFDAYILILFCLFNTNAV